MISVGSRNGRKGIEFSYGSEEMAETELEEGEACFQNEDDESAIDPDIALSYIVCYSVFTIFFLSSSHDNIVVDLILSCSSWNS